MNYLHFTGWLALMTWIVADTVPRYLLPLLYPVYDALEELAGGRPGRTLSTAIQILLSGALAYTLMIWSTWCVLRCTLYARAPGSSRALYFFTGFLCCEYALGKIATADKFRGFFLSVLPYTMAMGAFVVFTLNPAPMRDAFPWLIRWMGL